MDQQLLTLVRRVENGEPCIEQVCVVSGGCLFFGCPAPRKALWEATYGFISQAYAHDIRDLPRRERNALPANEADQRTAQFLDSFYEGAMKTDEHEPSALTLVDARCAIQATAFEVPALRIPLDSIDAWWFGGHKVKESGGETFLGVSFPLPS
jgi:hypothetical protein